MKSWLFCFIVAAAIQPLIAQDSLDPFPVLYQGRIRPVNVYTQLTLSNELKNPNYLNQPEELQTAALLFEKLENKAKRSNQLLKKSIADWKNHDYSPQILSEQYLKHFPLEKRLLECSSAFLALPSLNNTASWYPLAALDLIEYDEMIDSFVPIKNFTAYSNKKFFLIKKYYEQLKNAVKQQNNELTLAQIKKLSNILFASYQESLAGQIYLQTTTSSLSFPSVGQLYAEKIYYSYPLLEYAIAAYCLALIALLVYLFLKKFFLRKAAWIFFLTAFFLHSALIALRCYILMRPPVSNMFETVLYVPWVTAAAFILIKPLRCSSAAFISTTFSCALFLALTHIFSLNSSLENVQAVLNSHYWLIIHVMMIVASYGIFALACLLGHISLIHYLFTSTFSQKMSQLIFYTMWIAIALLIPGTILGGVWAAQSWGRFWDWDPKEAWAFITALVYLLAIHAYTFKYIDSFGLACFAILNMLVVAFTWYGVNYLLGTGLHSYGFGSGGEHYFYLFCLMELLFIGGVSLRYLTLKKRIGYKKN